MLKHILIAMLIAGPALAQEITLPNALTPGVLDPACNVEMLKTTNTTARRLTTAAMKAEVYDRYHMTPRHAPECTGPGNSCAEVDHFYPLALCGADAIENLSIESYEGPCNAHDKDLVEAYASRAVKADRMTLPEAQALFKPDWRDSYQKLFGKSCSH
jgi:hypothetical protein